MNNQESKSSQSVNVQVRSDLPDNKNGLANNTASNHNQVSPSRMFSLPDSSPIKAKEENMKRNCFIIALGLTIVVLSFALAACEVPTSTTRVRTDMPFEQLVKESRILLDDFWSKTFAANGWQYRTATGLLYYTEPIETACGQLKMENAYYCPPSHDIYFDDAFLREIYNQDGDFAVVTILAHEWGHLIQGNLGILDGKQKRYATVVTELQADCFAGAFAKYVSEMKLLEDMDLDEGGVRLFKTGDYSPWYHPDHHGRPMQRIDNYLNGWKYGIPVCFSDAGIRQFQPKN